MSRVSVVLIAFIALLCIAPLANVCDAQVITGTILGTVSDESKAALPGVTLTMKNLDTGETRTVTTDLGGKYRAPNLGLGRYEVRAELVRDGRTVTETKRVIVKAGEEVRATFNDMSAVSTARAQAGK